MTTTPSNNSQNEATPQVLPDSVSDPALNTEVGHDWSDEGGATPDGPAVPSSDDDQGEQADPEDPSQTKSLPGEPQEPDETEEPTDTNAPKSHAAEEGPVRNYDHRDVPTLTPTDSGGARLGDPRTLYPKISPPQESQPEPGLDRNLMPRAFNGAESYVGSGKLEGRRALITGGDSGIGAAVAIAFAREGAKVAIGFLPSEQADADSIERALESAEVDVIQLPGDLRNREYRNALVGLAAQELGGLDLLVNNAGKQISIESIEDLSDEQIEATFDVNVLAMYTLCRDAVKIMPPGSSIINTTSIQAYDPSPHLLDYAATKAAINNFTKGLAAQVGTKGIRVNAVAPGPIWTPLQPSHGQPIEALPEFGHNTYLGRAGQPAEVAYAYVFLAQPESSYILGETINVNGGRITP